jgi:hypothetical protein
LRLQTGTPHLDRASELAERPCRRSAWARSARHTVAAGKQAAINALDVLVARTAA